MDAKLYAACERHYLDPGHLTKKTIHRIAPRHRKCQEAGSLKGPTCEKEMSEYNNGVYMAKNHFATLQFMKIVLERRSRNKNTEVGLHNAHTLGKTGVFIFDAMGFVDDQVLPVNL